MSAPSANEPFTHTVAADRWQGMQISGTRRGPSGPDVRPDTPLIIAVHGGTYTSGYFNIPGY